MLGIPGRIYSPSIFSRSLRNGLRRGTDNGAAE